VATNNSFGMHRASSVRRRSPRATSRHASISRTPGGQQIFYRVLFEDLASPKVLSEPVTAGSDAVESAHGQFRLLGR